MVGYEEALSIARGCCAEVDYVTELPGAFVFSKRDDMSFGGNGPVVVLKEDGRAVNYVSFEMDGPDMAVVREGYIAGFGA